MLVPRFWFFIVSNRHFVYHEKIIEDFEGYHVKRTTNQMFRTISKDKGNFVL